jgi:8-oxo-dGTP pyrophosphatase MutT (NUDIX family)
MEEIMPTYQVGVKGIIFNSNKKVLVLLKKEIQKWDVPGGRTQKGETLLESLDRELKEEILNLKEYKVIKILNASKIETANLVLVYYTLEIDLENIELSEEHELYRWISYEDIDNLEKEYLIDPGIKETLKLAFNNY